MDRVVIIIISTILAMISIFWSTQMQVQVSIEQFQNLQKEYGQYKAYFYHMRAPGAVCKFGILAGRLILLYNLIFLGGFLHLTCKKQEKTLRDLFWFHFFVTSLIFLLMLGMNSYFLEIGRGYVEKINLESFYEWRGLFENSIPYFFFHAVILWAMS